MAWSQFPVILGITLTHRCPVNMNRIPVIIINGFLGAGKTTLMKNLLTQANRNHLAVSVIVNDMSDLDVDGVLIANTEIVNIANNNFVSITSDSISSQSGIKTVDKAIKNMLRHYLPDVIFVETSGGSHPLPLIKYLQTHERLQLKSLLSLVDTVMLNDDYNGGKALIPAFQENLFHGKRRIENLLAEQIMFCSTLLLTKKDRLSFDIVTDVAKAIHPLNPYVNVIAVSWGNLKLAELLTLPDYDFNRVGLLIRELEDTITVEEAKVSAQNGEIISRVIEDDRPFHPQRLWETYHYFMGMGIYRSKGFFWLPGRPDMALLWNQAAGSINLEFISYWNSGVLADPDNHLTHEERSVLQKKVNKTMGRFGDRRCQLTIIGRSDEVHDFTSALINCFLSEEEIVWWQSGGVFADPWPVNISRLN